MLLIGLFAKHENETSDCDYDVQTSREQPVTVQRIADYGHFERKGKLKSRPISCKFHKKL